MSTNMVVPAASMNGAASARPASFSQLWQVPVFLLGLMGLGIVAVASPLAEKNVVDSFDGELLTIRKALEQPGDVGPNIVTLAEAVVGQVARQPDRAGEAHYLLGAVFLRQAEKSLRKQGEEREKAGLHLELAALRGVPERDKVRLTYLRGKLAFLNKNMSKAIEYFNMSLPSGADDACEGLGMLVQAHLSGATPDIDSALAANLKQMENCGDDQTLTKARMLRGELLLKNGMRGEAIKVLSAIGPKSALDLRLKARLYQAKAAMEEGMWGRAAGWWQELLAHPDAVPGGKGRILYSVGVCWLNFDPPLHISKAEAAWLEAKAYGGEEAQAAALRLGELKLRSPHEVQAALPHFKEALDKITAPADYKNSLLELGSARSLLEEACQIFHQRSDNDNFLQAAELYKKLAPVGAAEEAIGQAAQARAQELQKKAARSSPIEGDTLAVQARDCFQKAALAYEQAAERRQPEERIDVLWRSIDCYRSANKPAEAVAVLKRFVELPAPAERKAEAWFTLAEIQYAINPLAAKDYYKQCVRFNSPTFTARALLQLSELLLKDHNLAEAEAVLKQVVSPTSGVGPIVDHVAHEAGLLKLANLYFQQRQYEKAAQRYKELVKQYPGNPNTPAVRDQLGQSYWRIAFGYRQERIDLPGGVLPQKITHLIQNEESNFEAARDAFQQNVDELEERAAGLRADGKTPSDAAATLLRRAYLKAADCNFEMLELYDQSSSSELPKKLSQAFVQYNGVFDKFPNTAEGLEACRQLAFCVGKAEEIRHADLSLMVEAAQTSVDHCRNNFARYDSAGAFQTVQNKLEWQDWLTAARRDLQNLQLRVKIGKKL